MLFQYTAVQSESNNEVQAKLIFFYDEYGPLM